MEYLRPSDEDPPAEPHQPPGLRGYSGDSGLSSDSSDKDGNCCINKSGDPIFDHEEEDVLLEEETIEVIPQRPNRGNKKENKVRGEREREEGERERGEERERERERELKKERKNY